MLVLAAVLAACVGDGDPPPTEPAPSPPDVAGDWRQAERGFSRFFEPYSVPSDFAVDELDGALEGCGTVTFDGGGGNAYPAALSGSVTTDSTVSLEIKWRGIDYDEVIVFRGEVVGNLISGSSDFFILNAPDDSSALWIDQPVSYQRVSTSPAVCP